MARETSVDKLVRESEVLREDLLRMAGRIGAWTQDLIQESAHLREESEEDDHDGTGSGEAGPADHPGSESDG